MTTPGLSSSGSLLGQLRLLAAAAVTGVVVGVAAVVFLAACQTVTAVALGRVAGYQPAGPGNEATLIPAPAAGPLRPWLLVPVATVGGLAVGWLTTRLAPDAAGAGTDPAVRAYHTGGQLGSRTATVKVLATAVSVGTGGSGGREGPMVLVGASLGGWVADRFRLMPADRRTLLAVGMGAGVAAVFRTPLAGALFAAEVLYRSAELEPAVLVPAATAGVAASATAGMVLGWGPILPAPPLGFASPAHLAAYALLAVLTVGAARLYVAALHSTSRWFRGLQLPVAVRPAIGTGVAAITGVGLYLACGHDQRALAVLGFGLGTLQQALTDPAAVPVGLLVAVAAGKLATTVLTVGSGGSGGVFGPALVIGGCGGAALGLALQPLGPGLVPPPAAFALLGMAGFFSAAAKTPFSTLVIVCELTGDFGLVTPALAVCVGCFVLSGRATLFPAQPDGRD